MIDPIFIIHFVSTVFMTGVIWIIQVIHYPTFHFISKDLYFQFQDFHVKRITPIVAPLMLIELGTGIILFFQNDHWIWKWNLILLSLIWLSTFTLSVPLHGKLGIQNSEQLKRKLVLTNWPRTLAWTVRTALISLYFIRLTS